MFWEALSSLVDIAGQVQKGNAQTKAAIFNANISTYNAGVTRQQGAIEETRVRRNATRQIGQMIANAGASGFDFSGSIEDVVADSVYEANYDALATRFNYKAKATSFDMEAGLYGQQAKDARKATYIGAASSLLKGATQIYKNDPNTYDIGTTFTLGGGTKPRETITWDK